MVGALPRAGEGQAAAGSVDALVARVRPAGISSVEIEYAGARDAVAPSQLGDETLQGGQGRPEGEPS